MSIPNFRTPNGRPPRLQVPAPLPPAPRAPEPVDDPEQVEETYTPNPTPFPVRRPIFQQNEAAQASQERQQTEFTQRTEHTPVERQSPLPAWQRHDSSPVNETEPQQQEVAAEPEETSRPVPSWRRGATTLPTRPEEPQPEDNPPYQNNYPVPAWDSTQTIVSQEREQTEDKEDKPRRNKLTLILVAIIAVLALLCGWLLFDKFTNTGSGTNDEVTSLQQENSQLKKELAQKNALLEAREGFIAALTPVNQSISEADGKVDVSENVKTIDAARDTVAAERENPANIEEQTRIVQDEGTKINEALAAWSESNTPTAPTLDTDVEKALNDVSKGKATVSFVEEPCGTPADQATACVSSDNPTVVQVATRYSQDNEITYNLWRMIMAHEYSHVIQYAAGQQFLDSDSYKNSFNSDSEWYADCMAEAFIGDSYQSSYNYDCSTEQLEYGRQAWNGVFA